MMSDKPICPLCDQRIYGGCMCISAEYSVRIRELEAENQRLLDEVVKGNQYGTEQAETIRVQDMLVDTFQPRITELEAQLKAVRELLAVAKCPNTQCTDGAIPHGPDPDGNWEAEQCQWCYERKAAAGGQDDE